MDTASACPRCGAPAPAGARFCGACGTGLASGCPACGAQNPPGNRFCGSCGSAIDPTFAEVPAAETLEERKVVTSLFADLTASTELAARLDPEELREILAPFFHAMQEEVARFGGTVEKFIGDAVVAFFGVPAAHEDDPVRAVRAGLAMQRRLIDLNQELAERAGGDLRMRIGVNTGDVFAHGGGSDEGLVTGEAVNIAARFQTLAEPGRVVVGERTWRDARHAFSFRSLGDVDVKGFDHALAAYEVEAETARLDEAGPANEAPFVGRVHEMDFLRLVLARTLRDRTPNLITVIGPPGIGKSRLARELAGQVSAEGVQVVRGRCLPYGEGLTYWPLAEILKDHAGILDSDPTATIGEKAARALGEGMPDQEARSTTAVLLSSIGIGLESDPLAGAEPDAAIRMIARAWQRYLETRSSRSPVVALIEDIHWADDALLDLIDAVLARARGSVLVLCMARPELYERRPGWGGGMTNASTVALSPLSAGEGAALLEHLLDGGAPAEVVGPILRRSEGNPFFAGELLRMMTEDGTLTRRDGRWTLARELPSGLPDTVQGVIASRIDLLLPGEKRTIQDAAVVGRIFWEGALERLGAPSLDAALEGLRDKGLIRERTDSRIEGERELIFHHVLTRDVAYASIPLSRRAQAHAVVGAWVESTTRGRDEEFAEILAYHADQAGDAPRTARYALLAGDRLQRVYAGDEAIRWYDRAMVAADDARVVARASLGRGAVREQRGLAQDALADYDRSFAEATAAGDDLLAARAIAARAHALWILDRYEEGQAILPEALARARAVGATNLEARLLYTAGTIRFGRADYEQALVLHEQGLEVAGAAGDKEGQALAHHGLCETYFFLGPWWKSLAHGEQADALLHGLAQRQMVAHNAYMLAWVMGFVGRWDEARAMVDGSIAQSQEIGNKRDEAFARFERSALYLSDGQTAAAIEEVEDAIGIFREIGGPRGELIGLNSQIDARAELPDLETIRNAAEQASALSEKMGSSFHRSPTLAALGWLALADGDRTAAVEHFAAAGEVSRAGLDQLWGSRTEVLAWEWVSDADGLANVAYRIANISSERDVWTVWGVYAAALAALLRGEHEAAADLGRQAGIDAEEVHERRVAWRSAGVVARALTALGRDDAAAEAHAAAAAIVRPIADALPDPLRSRFVARADVAALLAG
jgi:class 3 adenylate cyclase/tetratricopeptide (TPR) repeat protein